MKTPKHHTLIRRQLQARITKLETNGPLVAPSLVAFRRKCGRIGCCCQSGQAHLGYSLMFEQKGQTHSVNVPVELVHEVPQWIREYDKTKRFRVRKMPEVRSVHALSWYAGGAEDSEQRLRARS